MTRRTRVKFCGMSSPSDIALAVEAGADAVGVILVPASPRRVEPDALPALAAAIPPFVSRVAVVASPSAHDASLLGALGFTLQFSGEESAVECEALADGRRYIKAFHVSDARALDDAHVASFDGNVDALWMFDSRVGAKLGGTGVTFAWDLVAPVARMRPVVVSGGLTPDNVASCVRCLRPYAVDVRNGIETEGRTDKAKMRAFVRAVREADGT